MPDRVQALLASDLGGPTADRPPTPEEWPRIWGRLASRYDELDALRAELERSRHELREARQAAIASARSEKGRAQFIANLSHELRTPLNAILGYSDLVREELQERGESTLVEDVARIDRAGRTLLGLINDVIDLAKIDAGRMKLAPERFDVAQVMVEAIERVRAGNPGARVDVELAPDLGVVSSDPGRLRQCVEHLVLRAVLAAPTLPVAVMARREGPAVNVRVRDSGDALSPEQQVAVFSEFADGNPQRADGTGLGLALCRRLVELLGGAVDVVSGVGGTTFTMRVPDQDAARTPAALELAAAADQLAPNDPRTVLVIDDDPDMQDLIGRILAKEGYRVAGAADGERGVLLAQRLRPRAILLDLILPGRSGWDVLTRLKSDPELAGIPVVVLSTVDDRSPRHRARRRRVPGQAGRPRGAAGLGAAVHPRRRRPHRRGRPGHARRAAPDARAHRGPGEGGCPRGRGARPPGAGDPRPDPPRSDDARHGRPHVPARGPREPGLARHPRGGDDRQGPHHRRDRGHRGERGPRDDQARPPPGRGAVARDVVGEGVGAVGGQRSAVNGQLHGSNANS
jgi:signal transduction histidine kinase